MQPLFIRTVTVPIRLRTAVSRSIAHSPNAASPSKCATSASGRAILAPSARGRL
ncbi:Uncharacterised protein [Bordetella pertussis]|nr:Uncharacterised protein [Bordetella pertussis]